MEFVKDIIPVIWLGRSGLTPGLPDIFPRDFGGRFHAERADRARIALALHVGVQRLSFAISSTTPQSWGEGKKLARNGRYLGHTQMQLGTESGMISQFGPPCNQPVCGTAD
jgi:hypothetical protein